ncbi:MAG: GTP-binding protein [Clostridiales Family XIII bacterium]|jgi:G3E family GTPase|nr:GTP-binding protein [Clostridiales Family XIII bacterium]
MTAEIYIVSGFLGAGKTTLIRKLLQEAFPDERIVVVENDFGEAGVDASLLRAEGAEVAELRAGCICCSLAGDLVKTLRGLIARHKPDKLIIEPSGVGKLSDVAAACADASLRALAEVRRKLTVVDAARCGTYLENFGEFFADQIEHADAVLLSRTEERPDRLEAARDLVRSLNARAALFAEPWEGLDAARLLSPVAPPHACGGEGAGEAHGAHGHDRAGRDCCADESCCEGHAHAHDAHCGGEQDRRAHGHDCGEHAHGCGEHGHLSAEEAFDTVTIRTERVFSPDELRARVSRMERGAAGTVLRAKGVLRGSKGYLNLQYIPGDTRIEDCATGGDALCLIGRDLNGPALADLFGGAV